MSSNVNKINHAMCMFLENAANETIHAQPKQKKKKLSSRRTAIRKKKDVLG
jgi:hypothetical protein